MLEGGFGEDNTLEKQNLKKLKSTTTWKHWELVETVGVGVQLIVIDYYVYKDYGLVSLSRNHPNVNVVA